MNDKETNAEKKDNIVLSSYCDWNMNQPNPDEGAGTKEIAEYIAKASQKIIDEMKAQDENKIDLEKVAQEIKRKSISEQEEYREDFNERRRKIREKFRRRI